MPTNITAELERVITPPRPATPEGCTVVAVHDTHIEADAAIRALRQSDIDVEQVSIAKSSKRGPVVLVVQAERDDRDMYIEYLRHHHFLPLPVSMAADALSVAARVDVIVTGILLPGSMDGIGFIARLKSDPRTSRIPVIVLTACAYQSDRDRAFAAGCDGFMAKPCPADVLVAEIRRVLAWPRLAPCPPLLEPPRARHRLAS